MSINPKFSLFQSVSLILVEDTSTDSTIPANVIKETELLLDIFIYGIPCRSALLPKEILNDTTVQKFPTQILVALCKVR